MLTLTLINNEVTLARTPLHSYMYPDPSPWPFTLTFTSNVDENIAFQLFKHALIEFMGNSFKLNQQEQTNKLALIITLLNPNANLILTSNPSLNPDPHQG